MEEEGGLPQELMPEDASRYLAQMKMNALDHLFAGSEQGEYVIKFRGKHPSIYAFYLAHVEWVILIAIENRKKIPWGEIDPIKFLRLFLPSVGGWRAEQAVKIAQGTPTDHRHSLLDLLRGR